MIFVLADTHVPKRMAKLPQRFLDRIKSNDIIFHAGDFVCWEVFQRLKTLATLHAVFGNMDDVKLRKLLSEKKAAEVQGKKIGLCHGSGSPFKLGERLYQEFGERCDGLIFEHSYVPYNRKLDNTLLFNPGSLLRKHDASFHRYLRGSHH